jgi:signal peptidase I
MMVGGDMESQGYSVTLEGVFRVVFNREELAVVGTKPNRGDRVVFTDYIGPGQDMAIELDARDEYDGPIDEKWSVAQFISTAASTASAAGFGETDGES